MYFLIILFSIIFKEAETQRQDLLVSDAAEELIKRGQLCLRPQFFRFSHSIWKFGIIKTNANHHKNNHGICIGGYLGIYHFE